MKKETPFAFLSMRTPGDLSSLQWYESPLCYVPPTGEPDSSRIVCDVYYAPLNFHDIMLATGKVQVTGFRGECHFLPKFTNNTHVKQARSGKTIFFKHRECFSGNEKRK